MALAPTGRLILMDMTSYCTDCAPTDAEARRLWGAGPFDPEGDLIKVGVMDADFARAHEIHCKNCERPMFDRAHPA